MAKKKKKKSNPIVFIVKLTAALIAAVYTYFFGGKIITENSDSVFVSGVVTRVVDGDTAIVRVGGENRRVRFLGIDTPETVHPDKPVQFFGKEASRFTRESLTGKTVWLEYDSSPLDKYQRHLAYIWTSKPSEINEKTIRGLMFNAKLLLGGYAKVMIIKPNKKYESIFRKFESEARNAKKGLWSR